MYFWLLNNFIRLLKSKKLFFWLGNGISITQVTWTSLFWCVHIKICLSWKYTLAWLTLVLTNVYLIVVSQQWCLKLKCFIACHTIKRLRLALTFICILNQRLFTIWWLVISEIWSPVTYFCTYLINRNKLNTTDKQSLHLICLNAG